MNIDHIFSLFDSPGKNNLNKYNEETGKLVDMFQEHPLVKIGMFKKMVLNYENYGKKLIKTFENSSEDLDIDEVKKAGEYMLYCKAFGYISEIDLKDKFHFEQLCSVSNKELVKAVKLSLKYFERVEEYEKCAILKEVFEIVNLNLIPQEK